MPLAFPGKVFEVVNATSTALFNKCNAKVAPRCVYLMTGVCLDMPPAETFCHAFPPLSAHIGHAESWKVPSGYSVLVPQCINVTACSTHDIPREILDSVGRIPLSAFKVGESIESDAWFNVLEVYAGLGGWTEGAHLGDCLNRSFAVEHDDEVAEVFARYAGDHAKVFVTKLESILGETGHHIRRGDDADELLTSLQKHVVHVVAGAPLCEGFSNMNAFLSGTNAIQKRKHLRYFVQTVLKFCPRYALMEMIPEITSEKHKEHLCATLLSLASASYQIQLYIVCNSDFGAASSRERFVLVATRGGIPLPPALRPTHADGDINNGVRWAITSRNTEMMNDRSYIEKLPPL